MNRFVLSRSLHCGRILRSPVISGTGEFKAGEGRVKALREKVQQQLSEAKKAPVAAKSAGDDSNVEDFGPFGKVDHEDVRNSETGEWGGYQGPEPTRFSDWEAKGRCTDF
eukprot:TRINITY_DN7577_c0_g1_i1.p1 TRINITY_DN7577_c0_g1~~TRINITY_DN7577_c0_g1_i1.p1  ORF type:complete len:110 (-),score=16.98 TRINITY_DN7577_c0_g1_i1:107-436(-)